MAGDRATRCAGGGLKKNEGLRIDYAFLSPGLAARCKSARMVTEPRYRDRPSDHIAVVVELEPG